MFLWLQISITKRLILCKFILHIMVLMEAFQKFYVDIQMYFPIGFNRISNYANVTKSIYISKSLFLICIDMIQNRTNVENILENDTATVSNVLRIPLSIPRRSFHRSFAASRVDIPNK